LQKAQPWADISQRLQRYSFLKVCSSDQRCDSWCKQMLVTGHCTPNATREQKFEPKFVDFHIDYHYCPATLIALSQTKQTADSQQLLLATIQNQSNLIHRARFG
jgi:hypothetical protein